MLVLERKSGMWTHITLNRKHLQHLLDSGEDANLNFRVYNIRNGKVDLAFDDPGYNYLIERPERRNVQVSPALI